MPNSSMAFTSVASEYLAGGSVKCWSGFNSAQSKDSPFFNSGKISSFKLSGYNFNQPSNNIVCPLARNRYFPPVISTDVLLSLASAICVAIARRQIKEYSLNC